jgi:adenylate cyclase
VRTAAIDNSDRQPIHSVADQLETILLGNELRYTRIQAAELAGISLDQASELWRALGFTSVSDDDIAFTDDDVTALANVSGLVEAHLIDQDSLRSVTRMVGQSMSRLAEWQSRLLLELLTTQPELITSSGELAALIGRIEPALEQIQLHVWRRQLAASAQRLLNTGGDPRSSVQVVGFVDLAGYTSLSRQLGVAELSAVLEEFETLAADVVAEHRGRVVKTIGDEVLFVATGARAGADLALELQHRAAASDRLPPLRTGLALGPVLARFGDVYGPVVNIASRLTGIARVGTILIDQELAAELGEDADYDLRRIRPISVRGYHHLNAFRLRAG